MPFSNKKLTIFLSLLLAVSVGIAVILVIFYYAFLNSNISKTLNLKIEPGTSKSSIIEQLASVEELSSLEINYLKAFVYINKNTVFEAGTYSFKPGTTYTEVLSGLKNGTEQTTFTFLPGWSIEQNSFLIAGDPRYKDFSTEYYNLSKKYQGYLYPDTYNVDLNIKAETLVEKQKQEFITKTDNLFNLYKSPLSKEEVVIIASIVQREALGEKDNRQIADILIKRYQEGMPLDADATTQYAVFLNSFPDFTTTCLSGNSCSVANFEFWKKSLNETDLKLESPFNTRGRVGLPPYPICNPTVSSIEAVLNPEKNVYYYYLHDKNGNTYFAKSLDEHVANINKYL